VCQVRLRQCCFAWIKLLRGAPSKENACLARCEEEGYKEEDCQEVALNTGSACTADGKWVDVSDGHRRTELVEDELARLRERISEAQGPVPQMDIF